MTFSKNWTAGEATFIEQYTRTLLVKWAKQHIQTLAEDPETTKSSSTVTFQPEEKTYVDYAESSSGWRPLDSFREAGVQWPRHKLDLEYSVSG